MVKNSKWAAEDKQIDARLADVALRGTMLRDQAEFHVAPQGDRQFAGHGNDHDAPHALPLPLGPVVEPLCQGRVRLMPDPQPGGLDKGITSQAIAGLGDALAASSFAAVIGAGSKADIACDLSVLTVPASPGHLVEYGLKSLGMIAASSVVWGMSVPWIVPGVP